MRHNVYTFFSHYNCLDEEFDAPDIASDHELCGAIVAGRAGQHPDAWGCGETSLTAIMPLGFSGKEQPPEPAPGPYIPPIDRTGPTLEEIAANVVQRRKERERKRLGPRQIGWWVKDDVEGEVEFTCDDCNAKFRQTAQYGRGKRDAAAAMLRQMGRSEGWTHIVGRDRCPACSFIPPEPLDVDQRGVV